jgi:hypothetical protein
MARAEALPSEAPNGFRRGDDLLRLVVEIKGYRQEDAKEKNRRWRPTGFPASIT